MYSVKEYKRPTTRAYQTRFCQPDAINEYPLVMGQPSGHRIPSSRDSQHPRALVWSWDGFDYRAISVIFKLWGFIAQLRRYCHWSCAQEGGAASLYVWQRLHYIAIFLLNVLIQKMSGKKKGLISSAKGSSSWMRVCNIYIIGSISIQCCDVTKRSRISLIVSWLFYW